MFLRLEPFYLSNFIIRRCTKNNRGFKRLPLEIIVVDGLEKGQYVRFVLLWHHVCGFLIRRILLREIRALNE